MVRAFLIITLIFLPDSPPECRSSSLLSFFPLDLAFAQSQDVLVYPLPLTKLHRNSLRDLRFVNL